MSTYQIYKWSDFNNDTCNTKPQRHTEEMITVKPKNEIKKISKFYLAI